MKKTILSRKDFGKLATSGFFGLSAILGIGALLRFFSYEPEPDTGQVTGYHLGDLSLYPVGSRTYRPDIPAVIYNRNGEFIAYSLICTHLGCAIAEYKEGFSCPCHGSAFDLDGKVTSGPAQKPLRKFRVKINEDNTLTLLL